MNYLELSGSTLAYLGDAVWSLKVREYLIEKGYTKAKDLQVLSVKFVSAKAQSKFYQTLKAEEFFTDEELEIYRRGRNYKSHSVPKNTNVTTYRSSTGFEALVGYWYLNKDEARFEQFWSKVRTLVEV